jgi:hypothetical protein
MRNRRPILLLLLIVCGITAALYAVGRTHSLLSFIFLCVVMVVAITVTIWYAAFDEQQ